MLMFSMQILFFKQAPHLFRVIYSRLSILDFVLNIISTLKTVQKALIRQDNGFQKRCPCEMYLTVLREKWGETVSY